MYPVYPGCCIRLFLSTRCVQKYYRRVAFQFRFQVFCLSQVAFQCSAIVDNGESVVRKSGRVRSNLRGQSITPILKNFEDNLLKEAYQNIHREYVTTVDGNAVNKKLKNNQLTHRLITSRVAVETFSFSGNVFEGKPWSKFIQTALLNSEC